jgi:hypothetical protein
VAEGNVVAIGAIDMAEGAKVLGQKVNVNLSFLPISETVVTIVVFASALLVFLLSILLLWAFRQRFENMSLGIEDRIWRYSPIGLVAFSGVTILLPLLAITLLAPVFYLILIAGAEMIVSIYIGRIILRGFSGNPELNIFLEFIIGFVIIILAKMGLVLLIPQIGMGWFAAAYILFWVIINSLGTGVLIDTKFGSPVFKPGNGQE